MIDNDNQHNQRNNNNENNEQNTSMNNSFFFETQMQMLRNMLIQIKKQNCVETKTINDRCFSNRYKNKSRNCHRQRRFDFDNFC